MLWHKRLGHVSKERMQKLIKENNLPTLDFTDSDTCVECIKGKMTNTRKRHANHSQELLEVIHSNICGPFPVQTFCKNSYFVTFIDDFSMFCYVYLIFEKSKVFEIFKIFKLKLKNNWIKH